MLIVLLRWLLLFFPLSFTSLNQGHVGKQYCLFENWLNVSG